MKARCLSLKVAPSARSIAGGLHHVRAKARIKSTGVLCSVKRMRGQDRRRETWWDKKLNCVAIEGQDFTQDTQEGGADRFELIPDSDEEGPQQVSSFVAEDDEFVPETEPQDMPVVKHIDKQGVTETRGLFAVRQSHLVATIGIFRLSL